MGFLLGFIAGVMLTLFVIYELVLANNRPRLVRYLEAGINRLLEKYHGITR